MASLRPLVGLGVDEAYAILVARQGPAGLPPLDAIENEDWGRDYLLSKFLDWPASDLTEAGLTLLDEVVEPLDGA